MFAFTSHLKILFIFISQIYNLFQNLENLYITSIGLLSCRIICTGRQIIASVDLGAHSIYTSYSW